MLQEKEPILKIKNVTKQFDLQDGKKLTALDNVTLELYSGECLGIVGESGCGKSTLANIITNLETLTSGSIIIDGEELYFSKKSFDLIISRNVTWTLKEPEKAYKNWFNLLKEDGRSVIFDANWYLRLAKREFEEEYEKNMELAQSMGYDCKTNKSQREECERIAKNLPMTYKLRPEWDKEALTQCGFKKTIVEKDISELYIHNEEEIIKKIGYDKNADIDYASTSILCSKGQAFLVSGDEAERYMHCLK